MSRRVFGGIAFTLAILAGGCGGDSPTDPGGNNNNDTRTVKTDPSFSTDVMEILTRTGCTASNCHGGTQGGLTLSTAAVSYSNLVNRVATTGDTLVVPGSAINSYLVKRLEGASGTGARMPVGGPYLDATDMSNVKNWINQGAKNN
ncbi:MAG: hypothetical protein OEZ65_05215 [Gemmatimonadota bacterium]|nr:hypothetical protein [Gemmatimonadota bacterium]MDH5758968.1 hypothetical protein [Gemmatimonadota bacterium]